MMQYVPAPASHTLPQYVQRYTHLMAVIISLKLMQSWRGDIKDLIWPGEYHIMLMYGLNRNTKRVEYGIIMRTLCSQIAILRSLNNIQNYVNERLQNTYLSQAYGNNGLDSFKERFHCIFVAHWFNSSIFVNKLSFN